jgi:two-component system, NtrC family, response regulator AtoC
VATVGRILVVDDQPEEIGDVLAHLESRFDVLLTRSLPEARASLSRRPDAILLDVRLQATDSGNTEGLSFLAEIRRELPFLPVVMYSGYAGVAMAVEAMKAGASDFLQKTASQGEVARTLRRAIQQAQLERRVQRLESELARHAGTEIVGTDPKMEEIRRLIRLVAEDGRTSVLIRGETGTGKELVARAIHGSGTRRGAPLIAVSLVSLNRETISSDLFGHEKGAFTGAGERRLGLIEEADGGILFLDEIGEVPLDLQAKLLRFLDDHQVTRLGSSAPIAVDLQLVAATNAPLEELVRCGRLREDLYYRLRGFSIQLPPLRERFQDLDLIARHFLGRMVADGRTTARDFDAAALKLLRLHRWPGNVRELQYAVDSAGLRAKLEGSCTVAVHHLSPELRAARDGAAPVDGRAARPSIDEQLACFELERIRWAVRERGGAREEARLLLGYSHRTTMWRRIRAHLQRFPHLRKEFPELAEAEP